MTSNSPQRRLPSVDTVVKQSSSLVMQWGHAQVTDAVREELARYRERMTLGEAVDVSIPDVHDLVAAKLQNTNTSKLRPVLNLSGTVLHTNLGRASLPDEAIEAAVMVARGPSNLEFDLTTGKRGSRESHVESLLCEMTGAEAATVVNNNAAAVLLVLNTLAAGKEVPVSRGELVEIGGSFRIPEVMQRSGCELVEVGATNRTHLRDYERAINENTALLLKVHASNYQIQGFTSSPTETELVALARSHKLPYVIDLGSGNLVDFVRLGLPEEPTAQQAIAQGADLITFSGDKLLGGPQAGLIAGRRDLIDQINSNPLKRALRQDKMTLAALEAVLRLYRNPDTLLQRLPTLRHLSRPKSDIEAQARRLRDSVATALAPLYKVDMVSGFSQIGSGALPVDTLPSACLELTPTEPGDGALRRLTSYLRELPLPVIGRMSNGSLLLDLRCLEDEAAFLAQLPALGEALR